MDQTPEQPLAFLRIKRKRNEEPLDALVVESRLRRKKSKGGTGVFQFAKTVEESVWEDEEQQKAIQHQLSLLAKQPTTATDITSGIAVPPPASPPQKSHQASDDRRYTIVERALPGNHPQLRKPTSPPEIVSAKELAAQRAANADFKMYDAILETPPAQDEIDPALEKLLQDYLKR